MTGAAKHPAPKAPADCADMAGVRAGIDAVDAALIGLLAQRAAYIDRAAELKAPLNLPARIGWRVEDVVAKVRAHAAGQRLDPDLAEALWRRLIGWSIAREARVLGDEPREARVLGDEPREEKTLGKDEAR